MRFLYLMCILTSSPSTSTGHTDTSRTQRNLTGTSLSQLLVSARKGKQLSCDLHPPHIRHVTSTYSSCKHTIMWLPHNSHVTSTLHVTCTQMAWLVCEKSFCHPHCIHLSWNFSTLNQFWGIGHYTVYIPRSYIQLAPRTVLPSLSLVPRPFVEETFYLINGLGTRLARS